MSDERIDTGEEPDKARGTSVPPKRRAPRGPRPRAVRVGMRLLDGRANSAGEAMLAEGLSPNTAINPAANGYGRLAVMQAALAVQGREDTLSGLKPLAVRTIRSILEDENENGATRANAAGGVLRLSAEIGEDGESSTDAAVAHVRLDRLRIMRRCIYFFASGREDRADMLRHLDGKIASLRLEWLALDGFSRGSEPKYRAYGLPPIEGR